MSTQPVIDIDRGSLPQSPAEPAAGRGPWSWIGLLLPLLAVATLVVIEMWRPVPEPATIGTAAPDFALSDTHGGTQSLTSALADSTDGAVLYFSMGVGCGGCFAQIPEIEPALAARGITLVSVVVDDAEIARVEAERYGATGPIALDPDRSVSEAYGMLGVFGHGDRPSHSFVRIGADGVITEVRHYAEMFIPRGRLLADLGLAS